MTQISDMNLTKRLKTTLANFHSYCQKRSQEHSEITQVRSKSNKSLTQYRSIRQIRKLSQSKRMPSQTSVKKKANDLINGQILQMKSSDLIEIIKIKLNCTKRQHLKTEETQSKAEGRSVKPLKMFNGNYNYDLSQYKKGMDVDNSLKKKKVSLIIQNSKSRFLQKTSVQFYKNGIYDVTLKNRPSSAIVNTMQQQPADQIAYQSEQPSLANKYSYQFIRRGKNKTVLDQRNDHPTTKDIISAWETPLEEDFIPIQNVNTINDKKKKRKN